MLPPLKPVLTPSAIERFHHHKPPPLPDGAAARIEAILEEADRELKVFK
jgi:hypothetical protein